MPLMPSSRSVLGEPAGRPSTSTLQPTRRIGHPSETGHPHLHGGRGNGQQYRRFQDSSFSSFSDSSSMIRRPSIDTISTYLSHESMYQQYYRNNSRHGSFYGGSLGSQSEHPGPTIQIAVSDDEPKRHGQGKPKRDGQRRPKRDCNGRPRPDRQGKTEARRPGETEATWPQGTEATRPQGTEARRPGQTEETRPQGTEATRPQEGETRRSQETEAARPPQGKPEKAATKQGR